MHALHMPIHALHMAMHALHVAMHALHVAIHALHMAKHALHMAMHALHMPTCAHLTRACKLLLVVQERLVSLPGRVCFQKLQFFIIVKEFV